jgi:hypothetical protein
MANLLKNQGLERVLEKGKLRSRSSDARARIDLNSKGEEWRPVG